MSLQKEIRNTAALILTRYSVIDGLINNVGTWMSNHSLTKEGIENCLCNKSSELCADDTSSYPALKKAEHARIINVASKAHSYGKINIPDPGIQKIITAFVRMDNRNLANLYFTFEFDALKT
jgi:NAD(P)-dependent dehydrogenase (short-subunit alcohol dehydrogenase family)